MTAPDQRHAPPPDGDPPGGVDQALLRAQIEHDRVQQFHAALVALTPRVWVTHALVGLNAAFFVVMVALGVHPLSPTIQSLLTWGANYAPLTTDGQWWRLLSATFIHIGVIHLAFNMYVLWGAGQFVERLMGNVGFIVLYLLAGLAGSLASTWYNPYVVSAGASGAVFGVYGALIGYLVLQRRAIPPAVLARLRNGALIFVGLNVFLGLRIEGIDMAAHLGGLLGGFLCGLALSHPLTRDGARRRGVRNLLVTAAGAALVCGMALLMPRVAADPRIAAERERFAKQVTQHENRCLQTWLDSQRRHEAGTLSDADLASRIQRDVLPCWRELRGKLKLPQERDHPRRAELDRLERYLEQRQQAWQLQVEALQQKDPGKQTRALQQQQAAGAELAPLSDGGARSR